MKTMRADQVQDFFKEFRRFMFRNGDLPREIQKELETATSVAVQSTPNAFAIQYVTEDGTTKTYQYELPLGTTEAMLVRSTEVDTTGNSSGVLGGGYLPPNRIG